MADRVSDKELWKVFADELANPALAKLNNSRKRDDVAFLLRHFLNQVLNSASVIAYLAQYYDGKWGSEAAVLLRRAYDISFQAMYLVKDSDDVLEKAQDHQDYIWIDKVKKIRALDHAVTLGAGVAKQVTESPKRIQTEVEINAKCERSKKRQKARYGKVRRNWYGRDLCEVAKMLGMLPEYLINVRELHAVTHFAPSVRGGSVMSDQRHLLVWVVVVASRVIKCNLDYHDMSLGLELDDHLKLNYEDTNLRYS